MKSISQKSVRHGHRVQEADESQLIPETRCSNALRKPTGRAVRHPRLRVDRVHSLDLRDLRRAGVLAEPSQVPRMSQWRWGWEGRIVGEVGYAIVRGNGRAAIALTHPRGPECNWDDAVTYWAQLLTTCCHFGGVRYWFRCPASREGRPCGRRCRVLYRPLGANCFACRLCHGLTYESRAAHRDKFYEGWVRPAAAQEALKKAMDPRASIRRRFRASERAWKALPGLFRLGDRFAGPDD
jgi:hypothetical protein